MDARSGHPGEDTVDGAETVLDGPVAAHLDPTMAIASDHDAAGVPIHRGWAAVGSHHRWMEPFVMVLLAGGAAHGYAIVGELAQLGITNGTVDVGAVYRTLRDLEQAGQVSSSWTTGSGPARRDYELTGTGYAALDEWAAVMRERARLGAEFDARYLETVVAARPRR
ncbi:MAG: PadR family transcriptional regulator [Candidatus Limnocylindrales bacterium]